MPDDKIINPDDRKNLDQVISLLEETRKTMLEQMRDIGYILRDRSERVYSKAYYSWIKQVMTGLTIETHWYSETDYTFDHTLNELRKEDKEYQIALLSKEISEFPENPIPSRKKKEITDNKNSESST